MYFALFREIPIFHFPSKILFFVSMIDLLNNYLAQFNKLSIPGLGTIYLERIPAQSDFINKQLLPPSYRYRFDKYFDVPDKEFFSFFAASKEIPDYEAIRQYNEWAQHFRDSITPYQAVEWKEVGKLYRDVSGEVVFESYNAVKSYLTQIPAVRVIRTNVEHTVLVGDREVSTKEMSELLGEPPPIETHVEKESWLVYALIIAAIACVVIFFHFYKNGLTPGSFGNQQKIDVPR